MSFINGNGKYIIGNKFLVILRCSIGIIYIWFGIPKFFPGYSPAEELAVNTIYKFAGELIPANVSISSLALWETLAGLLLITGVWKRGVLMIILLHLMFTFTPLIFFPTLSFKASTYGLTLMGQYIMKNIVVLSAIIVLFQTKKLKEAEPMLPES